MWELVTGSLLLSIFHASIPNHWLPLVAVSKAENWKRRETFFVTVIVGMAHTSSSIIIGLIIGRLGFELISRFEAVASYAAPAVLVVMGLIYLALHFKHNHHHHHFDDIDKKKQTSKKALVLSLAIAMFFSPCIEIEAFFFHAGTFGFAGVLVVSLIYLIVTVSGMVILVTVAILGAAKFRSHFLEHNEKLIAGIILMATGVFAYFVDL